MTISKLVPRILGLTLTVFAAVTAWAMTVTGILEQPSLDVDHFDAGAGNNLLLLRAFLALTASGLAIVWVFLRGTSAARLARVAVAPSVLLVLVWSVLSLNRFAPGFSEEEFLEVLEEHRKGELLTATEVASRLGTPLITASRPNGDLIWGYTYTPSGGFGWYKRTLTFDAQGTLVDVSHLDEP